VRRFVNTGHSLDTADLFNYLRHILANESTNEIDRTCDFDSSDEEVLNH